MYAMLQFPIKQ